MKSPLRIIRPDRLEIDIITLYQTVPNNRTNYQMWFARKKVNTKTLGVEI